MGYFVLCDETCIKSMVSKSTDILQIYNIVQLTFQGRTKGTLINHLSITPLTIINRVMLALTVTNPKPTETLNSFTVLTLIHTCVTKVYSLSVYVLDSTKHSEDLPESGLFAQVLLDCPLL